VVEGGGVVLVERLADWGVDTVRIHPAVLAQAAATAALMLPGRFQLGVGSGENLNEPGFFDFYRRELAPRLG
jgi:alkanesulfonate monooxygenase SsuD/methylene tetrahydromethanopterin reductase-like flavin-dependent oxidoreductase (luciferase family)